MPSAPSSGSRSHTGSIAGGVIGGIEAFYLALSLAVALFLYGWRRIRRRHVDLEPGDVQAPPDTLANIGTGGTFARGNVAEVADSTVQEVPRQEVPRRQEL